ncbi:hypothetical protein, partial [Mycoplasma leonicaptivi]|uniref:hypothetical protein n=1 Tax=Mycoplasma leonicaptivi TaxID=36742 RepID=UPI000481D291
YDALKAGENLDYSKIESNNVSNALFKIIDASVKTIYSKDYIEKLNQLIEEYSGYINLDSQDLGQTENFKDDIMGLTFAFLKASEIDYIPFYFGLTNSILANIDAESKLKASQENVSKKFVPEIFEKLDFDLDELNKFQYNLKLEAYKLRTLSNLNTFNIQLWYDRFTNEINNVWNEKATVLHTLLRNDPELNSSDENVKNQALARYQNAYNKMIEFNEEKTNEKNNYVTYIGAVFMSLGIISTIMTLVAFVLQKSVQSQNKFNTKKIFSIIALTSTIISVVGIVLLILGLGGIL